MRVRFSSLLALAALSVPLALASGCRREPAPLGPNRRFVPVVVRSSPSARTHWRTEVEVTPRSAEPTRLRVGRWPPDLAENEVEEWTVTGGAPVRIPFRGPALPLVSSLYFEGDRPFEVRATVRGTSAGQPLTLEVPVLRGDELALPGDRLLVGPFRQDEKMRTHFCFTVPWTERNSVPYRVKTRITLRDGREMVNAIQTLPGIPSLVEDPWEYYGIPKGEAFDLEVTFLASGRGRRPDLGMWIYAIEQERATGASRFLTTRIVRSGSASPRP